MLSRPLPVSTSRDSTAAPVAPTLRKIACAGLVLACAGLLGCHSPTRVRLGVPEASYENLPVCPTPSAMTTRRPSQGRSAQGRSARVRKQARRRPGRVEMSATDLAPVDAYLHTRNAQWILGDTVDVYASKEYFSQSLTLNAKIGLVHRSDEEVDGEEVTTLTFIGHDSQRSAMGNPRVMIGTGLTVSARKTLRVRLARTTNVNVPVQLRVVARGDASRGRKDQVLERAPQLELGGSVRNVRGRWTWRTIGG